MASDDKMCIEEKFALQKWFEVLAAHLLDRLANQVGYFVQFVRCLVGKIVFEQVDHLVAYRPQSRRHDEK